MARIKKKGTSGQAKNFITRTQAVRKLQISLPDFRRLCIFKGIYPREPRDKKKASKSATQSTTFYYTRDIQYLLHEPLLRKFREQKALSKKIARALGRGEAGDAARLEKNNAPRLTLDHLVKERYPTFVDALRDLDDCLSLIFLFANLPSSANVPPKTIATCQRLSLEFEHYLITTHSLRKSFLSIKGIYYQATIQGQDILWLVPYRFVQRVPAEVDYRIMATFVEFYITMLGFVNFRLFSSIGLVYPPKFDPKSDERGAELAAFTLEGRKVGEDKAEDEKEKEKNGAVNGDHRPAVNVQGKVDAALKNIKDVPDQTATDKKPTEGEETTTAAQGEGEGEEEGDDVDTFQPVLRGGDILPQPQMTSTKAASLFAPFTFYLSRETPRPPLEFLLRSFGCKRVGWDAVLGDGAFTTNELDPRITHQIVDRPPLPESSLPPVPKNPNAHANGTETTQLPQRGMRVPGRVYVQPQWVWDCANEGRILRTDLYAPGATLPPHLSPWVKVGKGEYDPRVPLEEQDGADEKMEDGDGDGDDDEGEGSESEEENLKAIAEMDIPKKEIESAEEDGEEEDDDDDENDDEEVAASSESEGEAEGESDEEEEEEEKEEDQDDEKDDDDDDDDGGESEGGVPVVPKKTRSKRAKEDEELERRKMMMSRKKRKLFEKMQYSNAQKAAETQKLINKRRKLEKQAQKGGR